MLHSDENITIALGCDHAGFHLKQEVARFLGNQGYHLIDRGTLSEKPCDYPDFAEPVARDVSSGKARFGVLICGTGIGMSIVANKFPGIRAALCLNEFSARYAREHNDANILTLGGRVVGVDLALSILRVFLETDFAGEKRGEDRHMRRVEKISRIEEELGEIKR